MSIITLTLEKEIAERLMRSLQKSLANAEIIVKTNKAEGEASQAVKYINKPNSFLVYDRTISKIYKKWCIIQARQLISYYKEKLEDRRRLGMTAGWVQKQELVAIDMIFRNPDIHIKLWYEAIDWFLNDDWYKDKVCKIDVIARNFYQFIEHKKDKEDPIYQAFIKATI